MLTCIILVLYLSIFTVNSPLTIEMKSELNTRISPEKAVEIFKKNGIEVAPEKAKNILEMLYFLAKLIVDQNFKT